MSVSKYKYLDWIVIPEDMVIQPIISYESHMLRFRISLKSIKPKHRKEIFMNVFYDQIGQLDVCHNYWEIFSSTNQVYEEQFSNNKKGINAMFKAIRKSLEKMLKDKAIVWYNNDWVGWLIYRCKVTKSINSI